MLKNKIQILLIFFLVFNINYSFSNEDDELKFLDSPGYTLSTGSLDPNTPLREVLSSEEMIKYKKDIISGKYDNYDQMRRINETLKRAIKKADNLTGNKTKIEELDEEYKSWAINIGTYKISNPKDSKKYSIDKIIIEQRHTGLVVDFFLNNKYLEGSYIEKKNEKPFLTEMNLRNIMNEFKKIDVNKKETSIYFGDKFIMYSGERYSLVKKF